MVRPEDSCFLSYSLIRGAEKSMGFGMVSIHTKGMLPGKSYATSMNRLALGVARLQKPGYQEYSNSSSGYLSEENKNTNSKRYICAVMFTATIFTIDKIVYRKQPRCPPVDEEIKRIWCVCVCVCVYMHTHSEIFSSKKE